MGTFSPDLNLFPPPPTADAAFNLSRLTAKLEPKPEPLDEETHFPTPISTSNSTSHHSFFLNFENGTVSPQYQISFSRRGRTNSGDLEGSGENPSVKTGWNLLKSGSKRNLEPDPGSNSARIYLNGVVSRDSWLHANSPDSGSNPILRPGPNLMILGSKRDLEPDPGSELARIYPNGVVSHDSWSDANSRSNPSLHSGPNSMNLSSRADLQADPGSDTTRIYGNGAVLPHSWPEANSPNSGLNPGPNVNRSVSSNLEASLSSPNSGPDAMALILVPESDNQATPRKKYPARSKELVRVTDLKPEDENYYRDFVRKTRMVFDSLRVLAEEMRRRMGLGLGARGDLRAATEMKVRGLWLFRDKRIVGAIPGIYVGDLFFFRMELCVCGLHGPVQAGIDYLSGHQSSNGEPIATSIVVSGGYEDDEDSGDVLIYTGQGGQDKNIKCKQVVNQKLERGNLGLERSMFYGIEVRVIRGFKYPGSASGKVYVYDGLYKVVHSWFDVGKSGLGVCKYKLERIKDQPEMGSAMMRLAVNLKTMPLSVRPVGYVSFDLSMGRERVPIYFYNDVDNDYEPIYHEYIATTVFPPYAYHGGKSGCECASGCTNNCLCAKKNGGEFAYDSNGLLLRGKPLIYECGSNCNCPPSCRNRVSQNGVKYSFEVFRSKETQWGVRSLDLIQAGSFICEFAGIALTQEQAKILSINGDSLVYPSQFAPRWSEWGDLSPMFTDYKVPSYPSVPPLDFALDVSKMRNVACYISHSLSPNVFVQFVLYDHNSILFPHLMLFAMENIPPMRELSLDYGVPDEITGKLRVCN